MGLFNFFSKKEKPMPAISKYNSAEKTVDRYSIPAERIDAMQRIKASDTYCQKIKDSGINPESLKNPVDALLTGCTTLEVEPIILDDASAANVPLATEVQESPDIEDE